MRSLFISWQKGVQGCSYLWSWNWHIWRIWAGGGYWVVSSVLSLRWVWYFAWDWCGYLAFFPRICRGGRMSWSWSSISSSSICWGRQSQSSFGNNHRVLLLHPFDRQSKWIWINEKLPRDRELLYAKKIFDKKTLQKLLTRKLCKNYWQVNLAVL